MCTRFLFTNVCWIPCAIPPPTHTLQNQPILFKGHVITKLQRCPIGIHHVNPGTITVLQRLAQDRELTLYDGTRLVRRDRYDHIKAQNGYSDADMVRMRCRLMILSYRGWSLCITRICEAGWGRPLGTHTHWVGNLPCAETSSRYSCIITFD
jgi:hypothetical protein